MDGNILLRGNLTRIEATDEVPNIYATQPITLAQRMHLGGDRTGDDGKPMRMPDRTRHL